jgi:transketolase
MRDTFVKALLEHARIDRNVLLITGDLGFGVLDTFSRDFPAQFINAGIAEQNMTGMAAGLALEGKNVFTYSIANFPTLRCLEQIRNDVVYHDASVNVVAVGGGFSYGSLGMSHHATEDIAIMRALPGLRVYAPCDELETRALVKQMIAQPAPTYLRIDKSKVTTYANKPFETNRLRQLMTGDKVAIVGYGGIVDEALKAAEQLATEGIKCSVYSAHTLKPFDSETLVQLARSNDVVVTVEEHLPTGGLGSLAADVFAEAGLLPSRFSRLCLPDSYSSIVGSQEYLRMRHQIDATAIAMRIRTLMGSKAS